MNAQVRPHIDEVPVLTDVIGFAEPAAPGPMPSTPAIAARGAASPAPAPSLSLAPLAEADVPVEAWLAVAESQITQQVLADVQRQVDRMFEYRVREAIGPALAQLTEQFVEAMRQELGQTLRDIVRRAVAQELARLRSR
ncbi:MAG: hypothetical protein L6Q75_06375 [Burkholderiaceae bacterium]|nr:hypothetical protein [Burkholderiaceae bacterium]